MNKSKEQQQARLAQIKAQWDQRRAIGKTLGRIKTKIGVYSAKGGVGKTTVAVNLATHIASKGYNVGLLDADIDTPNAAKVFGGDAAPSVKEGRITPALAFGVKVVSMSFFQQNEEEAIIWRGPMIHNAINQFLQMTEWGDLDFLVVDMPPGTSDSPLTVMQVLSMDGFVVVTTPQKLAALDAKRSINMIKKLNVEVLGVVENYTSDMFGTGAGPAISADMDLAFLGYLALRPDYQDDSQPTVLVSEAVRGEYDKLWEGVSARLFDLGVMPEQASEKAEADAAQPDAESAK
ncbi:MAG: Mrp/NBP35 family ATP-binding protein [Dehalococcoidia bacterium]